MSRVRVDCLAVSLDGFVAGPGQDLEHPLGAGGEALHDWVFPTRAFRERVLRESGGETGVDNDFAVRGFQNIGAWIMGRNMFGPVRGPWPDDAWRGWWGDSPPFHADVFVLTHHRRNPISMADGTTFNFVTGGIHEALERARDAASEKDVRVGGGAETVRQFVEAQLVDQVHLVLAPVLMGRGENLFANLDLPALGYASRERVEGERATHVLIHRDA